MSEGSNLGGQARGQMDALIIDLSEGGARLELPAALEVGALHDFTLRVGGEMVLVHAKVLRCGPRGQAFEVAVEFAGVPTSDATRLGRYLER